MVENLVGATQVGAAISKLACQLLVDYPSPAKRPLFVALLKGAAPFAAELMLEIQTRNPKFIPELEYLLISTYGSGHESGGPKMELDVADSKVSGREVIVLDDCLDSGKSYAFARKNLLNKGATSVKLAVLIEKDRPHIDDLTADYFGFKLPDVWLVGMGMDDGQKGTEFGRWLNYIAKV